MKTFFYSLLSIVLLIGTSGFVAVDAETGAGVTGSTSAGITAEGNAQTTGIEHEDIGITSSAEGEIDGDPDRPMEEGRTPSESIHGEGEDMMEGEDGDSSMMHENERVMISNMIRLKAVEVRGWNPEKKEEFLGTVKIHAEVQSEQDLENFARGVLLKDEQVEGVEVTDDTIAVDYRIPARLFGVFNASFRIRTEVKADGEVKVKFPWYSIFYSVPEDVQADALEADLRAELSGMQKENTELQGTLSERAEILAIMAGSMKIKHDTAMSSIRNLK